MIYQPPLPPRRPRALRRYAPNLASKPCFVCFCFLPLRQCDFAGYRVRFFFDFVPFRTSWGPQKTAFRSRRLQFLSFSVIPSDFLRGGFLGVLPSPPVTRLGTTWRTFKGSRDAQIDFAHPHFRSVFNFMLTGASRGPQEGPKRAPREPQEGPKRA